MTTRPSITMIRDDDDRGVLRFDGRSVHSSQKNLELVDGQTIVRVEYNEDQARLTFWPSIGDPITVTGFTLINTVSETDIDVAKVGSQKQKTGSPGETGIRGTDGLAGKDGSQGPQGHQGRRGQVGRQGERGVPGVKGYAGTEGEVGDQGDVGREGRFGRRGTAGYVGERGRQGQHGHTNVVVSLNKPKNADDGTLWIETNPLRAS